MLQRYLILFLVSAIILSGCTQKIIINRDIQSLSARLDNYLQAHIQDNRFPGVQYLLFNDKSIIYQYSGGYTKVEQKEKVRDHSVFNVFSTTKVITAIAILQLAESGLLSLDDKLEKHINNTPYKGVTLRQILSHSSGIPNTILGNFYIHWSEEHESFNPDKLLKDEVPEDDELDFNPGDKMSYSNLGYALLGKVIETVTDQGYEKYVEQNIFKKLKLDKTEINFDDQSQPHAARPYFKRSSLSYNIMVMFLDNSRTRTEGMWTAIDKPFYFNFPAHGGIIASAREFSKIFMDILRKDSLLLSSSSKQVLFNEQLHYDDKTLALSWFKAKLHNIPYYYHQGGGLGYISEVRLYPEQKLGSIILINKTDLESVSILNTLDYELIEHEYLQPVKTNSS